MPYSLIRLFTSNRLEHLVEHLVRELSPPLDPLEPEVIVVQSRGMEHHLSLELAKRQGIAANIKYYFPIVLIYELFKRTLPNLPSDNPFDQDILVWKIMALLPNLVKEPGFEPLQAYLQEGSPLKRLQLAEKIAYLLDQYLIFRPKMIQDWDKGSLNHFIAQGQSHEYWQAKVWREVSREQPGLHRAALKEKFYRALEHQRDKLPKRLSIFGISSLPLFHLQILAYLSQHCTVNLFALNPSREYWGAIQSRKEKTRLMRHTTQGEVLYAEEGNTLLASMGTLGRDFFDSLYEHELVAGEMEAFPDQEEDSLLHCVQNDILNLANRLDLGSKGNVALDDRSISVHSCHSPMREVEVLYDNLLYLLERDRELRPQDILVMTPDIETYAPYIQAVFDCPPRESMALPYTISERSLGQESLALRAFMEILHLGESRFEASKVLSILSSPLVARRFGLGQDDLDLIGRWIREARICWGIDASSRTSLGLPAFKENTWLGGLERLLLGYALPSGGERMFGDILPHDPIEGAQALVLGRFLEFFQRLITQVEGLGALRGLVGWQETLSGLLDDLFVAEAEGGQDLTALRQALLEMGRRGMRAGYQEPVGIDLVRYVLGNMLRRQTGQQAFLSGVITFSSLLPFRTLPFKVICLLGLNDTDFPRSDHRPGFDLLSIKPQKGDRSNRQDDRYLFLEALISARRALYISYRGQSIQDNSPIPPSVLVADLLDYIGANYQTPDGADPKALLLTEHRLQAFHPSYFPPPDQAQPHSLFSFSEENRRGAGALMGPRMPLLFIADALPREDDEGGDVTLDNLCQFFAHPARFLLNRRLRIQLRTEVDLISDVEPLHALDGLERYLLGQDLIARLSAEGGTGDLFRHLKASYLLPPGTVGDIEVASLKRDVSAFWRRLKRRIDKGHALPSRAVHLSLEGVSLRGQLRGLYDFGLIRYRFARIKAEDRIRAWIEHLALCALPGEIGRQTWLLGQEEGEELFLPVSQAEAMLRDLVRIMRQGLIQPLPFFPALSWDYSKNTLSKGMEPEEALRRARHAWQEGAKDRLLAGDAYNRLCFMSQNPIDEAFAHGAVSILEPLMRHHDIPKGRP